MDVVIFVFDVATSNSCQLCCLSLIIFHQIKAVITTSLQQVDDLTKVFWFWLAFACALCLAGWIAAVCGVVILIGAASIFFHGFRLWKKIEESDEASVAVVGADGLTNSLAWFRDFYTITSSLIFIVALLEL